MPDIQDDIASAVLQELFEQVLGYIVSARKYKSQLRAMPWVVARTCKRSANFQGWVVPLRRRSLVLSVETFIVHQRSPAGDNEVVLQC